ncbi:hypothetical protein Ddye_032259 [Dipteronia dyeriana]|uniref:AIR12 DOMON domain-containing protein n=1 Tax=Dipteronia dyeriana TaxID=168575 RepID=A0AAD9TKI5_9ROSI|nr:hypothetical protein Ddye_032259 [Dipteronia dyeriana]
MAGSQCPVADQNSTTIHAYTHPIGSGTPQLQEGSLSFKVPSINATFFGTEMTIYATLQLTSDLLSTNKIWQEGLVNGNVPAIHSMTGENALSTETIDFRTGETIALTGSVFNSKLRKKNVSYSILCWF